MNNNLVYYCLNTVMKELTDFERLKLTVLHQGEKTNHHRQGVCTVSQQ